WASHQARTGREMITTAKTAKRILKSTGGSCLDEKTNSHRACRVCLIIVFLQALVALQEIVYETVQFIFGGHQFFQLLGNQVGAPFPASLFQIEGNFAHLACSQDGDQTLQLMSQSGYLFDISSLDFDQQCRN